MCLEGSDSDEKAKKLESVIERAMKGFDETSTEKELENLAESSDEAKARENRRKSECFSDNSNL